jgi:cerevisin
MQINNLDDVDFIELDSMVHTFNIQKSAPWGLDRISHRALRQNNKQYIFNNNDGLDVDAYIIDTGVYIQHTDFEHRARWGASFVENGRKIDGNGHGTHVAATVAGKQFGVAKNAHIIAVRVLDSRGSGSTSGVIRGIEWATKDHKNKNSTRKSVANMSLGGSKSKILDMAVNAAVNAGIHFAVAAGNDNVDACDFSPAASKKAITVGASTSHDLRAWFSNVGHCVDIFAPGHEILSAWIGNVNATNTISGTSMASPHIAGVLAALVSRPEYALLSPRKIKSVLLGLATKNVLKMNDANGDTINLLVYSNPTSILYKLFSLFTPFILVKMLNY